MRLKIDLFTNWAQQKNETGPATFSRDGSTAAFQVSWAEYRGPQPLQRKSPDELKQFAADFGRKNGFGDLVESSSGDCKFGNFGTAVFQLETHPRIQVWIITNGRDHILATHICDQQPEADEITEVQKIAGSLALGN